MEINSNIGLVIGLSSVIVAVDNNQPKLFIVKREDSRGVSKKSSKALPFGKFDPNKHKTLEKGLIAWVKEQTPIEVKYVEQLYTFSSGIKYLADDNNKEMQRFLSIGYIALTNNVNVESSENTFFDDWYKFFPWEDWRKKRPEILDAQIMPKLKLWVSQASTPAEKNERQLKVDICFGSANHKWDEEKTLQRYELLYEAQLVAEYFIDNDKSPAENIISGDSMIFDHRRILATAIGRLRGKLKYRPYVYELMPTEFTLLRLQNAMEAVMGKNLHKQNFRRFVESSGMIEQISGKTSSESGGRPAALFRFKREVAQEYFI